jgi:fumarate hydratase subunit alpha
VFVDIGQDVHVTGGAIREAIDEGVRQGYRDGYLRSSVKDFLTGENTGDNTPAVIHFDVVPGDKIRIAFMVKGGGSENMSRVTSLAPSEGEAGIRRLVLERVREAGGNPCPPTIVGVGVAGTQEQAALLAKRALLRPLGEPNPEPKLAKLELELLEQINQLGIGPQGLGGRVTALGVHVSVAPHHIAGMAVAVNLQCHSLRHKEVQL